MLLEPVDPNERFRARRRQARKRRAVRRTAALAVVALAAAGTTLGARFLTERDAHVANSAGAQTPTTQAAPAPKPEPRRYPDEIRGVHVTMALASVPGKVDEYLAMTKNGLNTLELDVKDENGEVAFRRPKVALAHEVDAAKDYYDPVEVAQKA